MGKVDVEQKSELVAMSVDQIAGLNGLNSEPGLKKTPIMKRRQNEASVPIDLI